MSDWGFGGFGGSVGVSDVEGAVGFHDESDLRVMRGSVVMVFAEQTAVAGAVDAPVFLVVEVVYVAVDGFLVTFRVGRGVHHFGGVAFVGCVESGSSGSAWVCDRNVSFGAIPYR